jgi:hypothetical protein
MSKDIKNFHWRPCGKFKQIGPPRISPRGGMPLDWHNIGMKTVEKPFGKLVEDVAALKQFLGCLAQCRGKGGGVRVRPATSWNRPIPEKRLFTSLRQEYLPAVTTFPPQQDSGARISRLREFSGSRLP